MEFKGTKGDWGFVFGDSQYEVFSEPIYTGDFKDICNNIENEHDALLISKAPEMLDMLNKARIELSRIKSSMMAHPDCTIGSEFDDYTSSAQECENEIELLIKEATEL